MSSGSLAWPQTFWKNSNNPGPNPDHLPSIPNQSLRHPSPSQHFGLVPTLNGHSGIHPIHDRGKSAISSHQTMTLPLLMVNFMMIVAFKSYAYYLYMHPHIPRH